MVARAAGRRFGAFVYTVKYELQRVIRVTQPPMMGEPRMPTRSTMRLGAVRRAARGTPSSGRCSPLVLHADEHATFAHVLDGVHVAVPESRHRPHPHGASPPAPQPGPPRRPGAYPAICVRCRLVAGARPYSPRARLRMKSAARRATPRRSRRRVLATPSTRARSPASPTLPSPSTALSTT